ncbi:MAG: hypothetical protein C5B54_04360 [Acidobacteria bacterium]|nr:MAG: hypothetical protein C5B54_04360 [Acidobacteriota bacterium]
MKHLKTGIVFFVVPLLLELSAYLFRENTYPGYLPFFSKFLVIFLTFFYFAILFVLIGVAATAFLRLLRLNPAHVFPASFLGLFLALILSRLLPYDSGYSAPRLFAFGTAALLGVGAFLLFHRKQFPEIRLFTVECLFSLVAAVSLSHLFQFPFLNPVMAVFMLTGLFCLLLYLPARYVVLLMSFLVLLNSYPYSKFKLKLPGGSQQAYQRVILIGIDGLSPEVTFNLAKEGKLPHFLEIMKGGVSGTIRTLDVPFSPLVWNTIYTGVPPQQHGIMSFTFNGIAGAPPFLSLWLDNWSNSDWMHAAVKTLNRVHVARTLPPALSLHRQSPAIWNMVDQNGFDSIVVGGWTTYPPELIHGIFVSDFALASDKPVNGSYYPVTKDIDGVMTQNIDISASPSEIRQYAAKDERAYRISKSLFSNPNSKARFLTVYFCSVDAFGHHYGTRIDMKSTSEAERQQLTAERENIYQKMDTYLGDYLSMIDDHTLLILCSDHGFHYDKRQHNYPVDGTILFYGKGVAAKTTLQTNMYAIAPTILYALGLPPSEVFQSKPLRQAFQARLADMNPRKYQKNTSFLEIRTPEFEREKMQELMDLQYINH